MELMYFRMLKGRKPAVADLVEVDKKKYLVTRVNVPKGYRGKGIGTEILNEIVGDADNECVTLMVEPSPYPDNRMTKRQLIKYYERFGFEYISEEEYMVRRPKCNG